MNITFMQNIRQQFTYWLYSKEVSCHLLMNKKPNALSSSKFKIIHQAVSEVRCCQNSTHTARRPSLFQLPSPFVKDKRPEHEKEAKKQTLIGRIKKKQSSLSMIGSRLCKCSFKCIVLRQSAGLVSVAFFEIGIGPLLFCEWPVLIRLGLIYFTWGFPNAFF